MPNLSDRHGWETVGGAHPFHDISVTCQGPRAGIAHKLNAHVTVDICNYGSDKHTLGYSYQPVLIASVCFEF